MMARLRSFYFKISKLLLPLITAKRNLSAKTPTTSLASRRRSANAQSNLVQVIQLGLMYIYIYIQSIRAQGRQGILQPAAWTRLGTLVSSQIGGHFERCFISVRRDENNLRDKDLKCLLSNKGHANFEDYAMITSS